MTERKNVLEFNFNNSYAQLPDSFFTILNPSKAKSPGLIILNQLLAKSIGLTVEALQSEDGVAVLAGNKLAQGSLPLAQAYAGNQFGYFTMLGDGRALLLGEQITPRGDRVDIQLKGSGKTPYSRGGDGRASLGPMLREYIISEAMYALGIPTTRSLAVVTTGDRRGEEIGAILTRVATSHVRVGTFQYVSHWGSAENLKILADYTLQRHFANAVSENIYLQLLKEVIKRQAVLLAKWQLVGFVHGVMNTDNMAISGETIDYGPCAFMDSYSLATVFSSIDTHGRYSYGNQPTMAAWNLARFAETLLPLIDENQSLALELAQEAVSNFTTLYNTHWLNGMRAKLGLFNCEKEDATLIESLLSIMENYSADYTNTFLALTFSKLEGFDMFDAPEFVEWYDLWQTRLARQNESNDSSYQLMRKSNPALIPRNHRVEEALAAAEKGDLSVMKCFLEVLSKPYAHSSEQLEYSTPPPASSPPYKTYCGT